MQRLLLVLCALGCASSTSKTNDAESSFDDSAQPGGMDEGGSEPSRDTGASATETEVDSAHPNEDSAAPTDTASSSSSEADSDTAADGDSAADSGTVSGGDTATDADPVERLPAPTVVGEISAGHASPTWLWTWGETASEVRWRINDGEWWSSEPDLGRVTAPSPLDAGEHTVFIEAANAAGEWSESGSFTTRIEYFEREGYWNGVARDFAQSPLGHRMGVVCHNCYEEDAGSPAANLDDTHALLINAVADEADLLEFDVRYYEGDWRLEHDDTPGSDAVFFEDILEFESLMEWDQPLFIEVKERDPSPAALQELLRMVLDAGFATNGRPVFFRAFRDVRYDNLHYLKEALDSGSYPHHENYIRLHVLLKEDSSETTSGFHDLIDEAATSGFHGVNFNWRTPDLFNLIEYAKSHGLGTSMWTVPERMGEAWCASMREDIDALVVDYDLSDCRQVVEEDTSLVYLNTARADSDTEIEWYRSGRESERILITTSEHPTMTHRSSGSGLYGPSLEFNRALGTSLPLYDADNDPGAGFFLATTVEFDDVDLDNGEKQAIFSKADDGGFALELRGGALTTSLRFSVHIDGSYRYAEKTLVGIDTSKSHFIMAAYDGDGRVRLWLNNSDDWVDESSIYTTGVTENDSPVRLGADPEGSTSTRYHFSGRIQMAMLQKWRDH